MHTFGASELVPMIGDAERLGELLSSAAQLDLHQKPGPQLASLIRSTFAVEAVAIFDADLSETYQAGEWHSDPEQAVRNICVFETVRDDPETGQIARVLRVGTMPIGGLLLRGELTKGVAGSIAALIAITFDRWHSLANERRLESAKRVEQLRTTVLDSLAHAYKTPLTAIRVASSGLVEMGGLTASQGGLVSLIEEQAELLDHLTTRLLKTARLETQTLNLETIAVASFVDEIVTAARDQLSAVRVRIEVPREDLTLRADRSLLQALLTQYVENAGKYADAGSVVTIAAVEQPSAVVVSVHNFGPAIPAADYERIFDRYFRSEGAQAPGTGIGLSVAKQAALAHGGDVWVTSDADAGTTFFASLPSTKDEVSA
jgi:two-component system sensor histidine kinase KdpD